MVSIMAPARSSHSRRAVRRSRSRRTQRYVHQAQLIDGEVTGQSEHRRGGRAGRYPAGPRADIARLHPSPSFPLLMRCAEARLRNDDDRLRRREPQPDDEAAKSLAVWRFTFATGQSFSGDSLSDHQVEQAAALAAAYAHAPTSHFVASVTKNRAIADDPATVEPLVCASVHMHGALTSCFASGRVPSWRFLGAFCRDYSPFAYAALCRVARRERHCAAVFAIEACGGSGWSPPSGGLWGS